MLTEFDNETEHKK